MIFNPLPRPSARPYQWLVVIGWFVMIAGGLLIVLTDIFSLDCSDALAMLMVVGGMAATIIGDHGYGKARL